MALATGDGSYIPYGRDIANLHHAQSDDHICMPSVERLIYISPILLDTTDRGKAFQVHVGISHGTKE